jgi:hypothetical protein
MVRAHLFPALLLLPALLLAGSARAEGDEKVEKARQLFAQGTEQVKAAEWSQALASFERSAALKPHAITTYNIGACQRAIGSYARARTTFARALERNASTHELPDSLAEAATGFVAEIDRLLSHASVIVTPADALIAVDGAPLAVYEPTAPAPTIPLPPRMVAGLRTPGPGEAPPAAAFELVLDPGAHVFVLSRKGFGDVVHNRTFAPASTTTLKLELDRLPGVMHIASNQDRAVVTVAGVDVGMAPVDVTRPAGSYQVVVKKEGFVPYASQVVLNPGDEVSLRGQLAPKSKSIVERWWFWTGVAVLVAGVATTTYFVTRPAPTRPPLDGGGLGWSVPVQ